MKHKITRRLIGYFSIVLLAFALVVGGLFCLLFNRRTTEIHAQDMEAHAVSIAENLTRLLQGTHKDFGKDGGHGAFLRLIDEIVVNDVWLVDVQLRRVYTTNLGGSFSRKELPEGAKGLAQRVFAFKTPANLSFADGLRTAYVVVGAPVFDAQGDVLYVLLLHNPVDGVDRALMDGMIILLFSLSAALALAIVLSILLARHFITPLKKMVCATERMMQGDYEALTGVSQRDEIGALAHDIDELSVRLSAARKERMDLDAMRQDFISNISHELRTPVTVIKGSLEVLDEGLITDPQEMRDYVRHMLADINMLQRLVNDLLELSRLQNSHFKMEKSELNLADVLDEAVRSMRRSAEQRQITICWINEAGAFPVWGDYGRLKQMFLVVLDNAVKFSPCGGRVDLVMRSHGEGCAVSIVDHGEGISPEDMPHLFDRFYKVRSERNKAGSGLGLPIAKEIAARHDVQITCKSSAQSGTLFHFLFPASAKASKP